MLTPLVSLIIPAHNRIDTLLSTIQSALRQSHPNIETIIVDDASDPPISTILPKDTGVHVIRSNSNIGPGASREIGRQQARGEYIQYLDSDDWLHPQKIASQLEQFKLHPASGMCYCTSLIFEDTPGRPHLPVWSSSNRSLETILPGILFQRPWATSSCLWRRAVTDRVGAWSSLWTGEDIEYEVRAGSLEIPICHLPDALCFIRRGRAGDGLTTETADHLYRTTAYKLCIAAHLANSGWVHDPQVSHRLTEILFNQGIFLLSLQNRTQSRQCFAAAQPFAHGSAARALQAANISATMLPPRLALPVARWIRQVHFKPTPLTGQYP